MLVLQWLILTPIREYIGINDLWFHSSVNMQWYVLLTISLPVWLYFSILDSDKNKGTWGKQLLKLNLINQEQGNRISFKKSFIRTTLKLLPWEIAHVGVIFPVPLYFASNPEVRIMTIVGLILFAVYFLSIALDKNSQSLYDKWLKVRVVST
jgi:uncharacterized RDD family membrane protein YckC